MLSALLTLRSVSTVRETRDEIRTPIPVFYLKPKTYITWPTVEEWRNMKQTWGKIPNAVGTIDATSHEIYRPSTEPQHLFFIRAIGSIAQYIPRL